MEILGLLLEIIPHFSDFLGGMVDGICKGKQDVFHSLIFILSLVAIGKAFEFLLLKWKERVSTARMHPEAGAQPLFAKWKETLVFCAFSIVLNISLIVLFKYAGKLLLLYLFVTRLMYRVLKDLFYPAVIAPKLVRSTPLPPGFLKSRIIQIAHKFDYDLKDVVVVENAKYDVSVPIVFLCKEISDGRIAISQRLIDKNDQAMIYALVTHHLVHWALSHHLFCFLLSEIHCVLEFMGFVIVMRATKILYELSSAYGLATPPVPSPSFTPLPPRLSPGFSPLPSKTSDMHQIGVVIDTLVFQFLYKRYGKLLRSSCSISLGVLEAKAERRAKREKNYEADMRRYYSSLLENDLDRAETFLCHINFDNGPPSLVEVLSNCVDSLKLE